ncbi:MAG: hypothetical protein MR635_03855, partial [Mollicutes bacterium]|nr:hypothetical protein [Mollicutes bacterium]
MSRFSKADIKMLKGKRVTLKIVDYGEDIKAKMVDYGEDAKFKKASFGCSAKEIKVKIVTYG